ncbi:adenylate kinase [Paenibacillus farraposensis]|uniref:Adenylate kinase n=1 Tax=Paenibacillus farraposensis TaxID=2807095 RepID=A0ABW4DEB7_9BACL|nr:adenylate kinase [Paenibacillus farraposensis]MCC3380788.1 adenylate kinase [Paenibacillus farraposensis]
MNSVKYAIVFLPLFLLYLVLKGGSLVAGLLYRLVHPMLSLRQRPDDRMLAVQHAKRIIVIGSPGSGKTSLAKRLSKQACLPYISLDDFYWGPEWKRSTDQQFLGQLGEVLEKEEWIIEGNYHDHYFAERLQRSDAIIVMDVSTIEAVTGVMIRSLNRFLFSRELPKGAEEENVRIWDMSPRFVRFVIGFRRRTRPKIWPLVTKYGNQKNLIILKSKYHSYF